jgi:hypothetical protein
MRAAGHQRAVAHHCRDRTGADGEIGKVRLDRISRERLLHQRAQRLLDEGPPLLARGDQRALDLARLDHASRQRQRIQEAEAGIGYIENLRSRRQPDLAMRERRSRRLQHVAAHRRVHKHLHLLRPQSGLGQHRTPRGGARIGGTRIGRPHPPLADPGHQFQTADGQLQPLVERAQPLLDLGGSPNLLGQRDRERFDADMLKPHG